MPKMSKFYVVSLCLNIIWLSLTFIGSPFGYHLRGGYTDYIFILITFGVSIGTVIHVFLSRSFWAKKFVITALHGPGIMLMAYYIIPALIWIVVNSYSIIILHQKFSLSHLFLLPDCTIESVSPSQSRSITVRTNHCWDNCDTTFYFNQFFLMKELGKYQMSEAFCNSKLDSKVVWSKDENRIKWELGDSQGFLNLNITKVPTDHLLAERRNLLQP